MKRKPAIVYCKQLQTQLQMLYDMRYQLPTHYHGFLQQAIKQIEELRRIALFETRVRMTRKQVQHMQLIDAAIDEIGRQLPTIATDDQVDDLF